MFLGLAIASTTPTTLQKENKVPSKEDIVYAIAQEEDFDPQIVINVINSETGSTWNCDLVGTSGELGCLQIIPKYHPHVDPLNFEESVRYFISEYRAGRGFLWTSCSCVKTAKLLVPELKGDAKDLEINATMQTGKVAILRYDDVYHAIPYKVTPEGLVAPLNGNSKPCLMEYNRLFAWEEINDHLVGFHTP